MIQLHIISETQAIQYTTKDTMDVVPSVNGKDRLLILKKLLKNQSSLNKSNAQISVST